MVIETKKEQDANVIIEFKDVHKWFDRNYVHRGVDLKILRGETITIIGGSGQGKTVLIKELTGLMLRLERGAEPGPAEDQDQDRQV